MNMTFSDLKKSYDGKQVLDIESGVIRSGSRTALIGPNGAGKSTLLKILAGLESADRGTVQYDGVSKFPQQELTLVFQKPYLISTTVERNIAYPMKLRGFTQQEIDRRVTMLLEELNLTEFRHRKSWKLSGGETQKVALARALSFYPKVLMLDEPTANIDPYTTAEIEKILLEENQRNGTTILLVTHNLAQAKRVCDEIIVLHDGKQIETGAAQKILTNPENPVTRRFLAGELIL